MLRVYLCDCTNQGFPVLLMSQSSDGNNHFIVLPALILTQPFSICAQKGSEIRAGGDDSITIFQPVIPGQNFFYAFGGNNDMLTFPHKILYPVINRIL